MSHEILDEAELREIEAKLEAGERPTGTAAEAASPAQPTAADAPALPPELGTPQRPWPTATAPRVSGTNLPRLLMQLRRLAAGADPHAGNDAEAI